MSNLWNTDLTDLNNFHGFTSLNLLLTTIVAIVFIITLVYFLKNYKFYNKYSIPLYFVIIILFSAAGFMYINRDQKIINLKADYEIAIGKIDKYIVTKGVNKINRCDFTFETNGEVYYVNNNSNPYTNLPNKKPNLELSYLVIYQKSKPTNSFILLNYPLKDSLDFLKLKAEFKNGIPKKVFRN